MASKVVLWLSAALLAIAWSAAQAQVVYPLNGNGSMGLGSPNGDFSIAQDDMKVKVPGGFVRINRDYDGRQWVFNRQWSGMGNPAYYKSFYLSIGSYFTCDIIDGISSCGNGGNTVMVPAPAAEPDNEVQNTRIPNDPGFGRDSNGDPLPGPTTAMAIARKGVGFTRNTDGTSYVSSKYPRFIVRPQQVPTLPASAGPDAHPSAGKPGQGGVATTMVDGFRWIDRSGEWIEYDNFGRISSYGDRNNVRVWFQYGGHGQVERILDDNGRTVFTLLYKDNGGKFITEARDHTPANGVVRRVQYHYDGDGRLKRVTDARGNDTLFEYGNGGVGGVGTMVKIVEVKDAEGRQTKIDYGVTGRIEKVTAPDGGATELEYGYDKLKKEFSVIVKYPQTDGGRKIESYRYDAEGRPVLREANGKTLMTAQGNARNMTFVDAYNASTTVQRDNFDEITKITFADGTSRNYQYEAGSTDVREDVDEAGFVRQYKYDAHGNMVKQTAAVGKPEQQVTNYRYNARGEAEEIEREGGTNPNGSSDEAVEVNLIYDDHGNVKEARDGENKLWTYEYDNLGLLTEATDPLGHSWSYRYDAHGNLLSETDPNQNKTFYEYDKTDRLVRITDGRQKISTVGYDAAGRQTTLISPYGEIFEDKFDRDGKLTRRTDAGGRTSGLSYDASGRLTKVTDGENFETLLDYTEIDGQDRGTSRPGKVTYPTFQRLFRYNERQRPVQQTDLLGQEGLVQSATHDPRGLLKTLTDPNGHTQSFEYDAFGRVTDLIDELGDTIKLGYDHRGNLISVTDGRGKTTRMEYDGRNLLLRETNAESQSTQHLYDDAGYLQEVLRPNGAKVIFANDPAGRPQTRKAYRPGGALEQTDTYRWDNADNLKEWENDRGKGVLEYDDADRLLSETVTIDGVALQRAYTYYPNDKVKTYTGPDGVTLTYVYDKNGELARLEIPGEGAISVTEWNWTAPKKITLPGGTVQEMDRDGFLALTRLRVKTPGQALLFELENRFGKLRELGQRSAGGKLTRYEYDEAVRLTKTEPDFIGGVSETYVIDKAGNRESHSLVSGTWEYDDANRLERRGDVSYAYDAAGNLVTKTDATLGEPLRTTHFKYDAYNRLVEVRDGGDTAVAAYAYDPFDNRIVKEVFIARNGAPVGKTLFLQGEEGLLAETSATGAVQRSYGWHPEHDYSTYPFFQRSGGSYFYYHNDHLGTPWRVTNREGAIVWSADDYNAFGAAKIVAGSQIAQPWRFPGQYFDEETGLHYNLRRYYDPETGRYISEDPLGFDSDSNFYTYANHAPTSRIDPTGEILPLLIPLAANYLRCVAMCSLVDLAVQGLINPCDIQNPLKDCAVDCLLTGGLGMLRKPCKWAKYVDAAGTAAGVAEAASSMNSFPGDTPVATPDGLKRIDELRPGDEVLSHAEWTGESKIEEVTDLVLSHHRQNMVTLTLEDGRKLEVTGGHPIRTSEGWRAAQLLKKGTRIESRSADGALTKIGVASVEQRQETIPVYNLEVSDSHNFYVGESGLLVHNGFGSYTITFKCGRKYHGKGDYERAKKSARDKARDYDTSYDEGDIDWKGAANDHDSFLDEAGRIRQDGGVGPDFGNLNKINSPGEKLLPPRR